MAKRTISTHLKGTELLNAPLLNKATAFSEQERALFNLEGLLPPRVETIEEQVRRCYEAYKKKPNELEKHIYLRSLQDKNETLFYALLMDHLSEMMPIIYTPVVGDACKLFSHIYRQSRGLFISYPMREKMEILLENAIADRDIEVIVVTDGERILGLGDQGVDGMGIPIGKLALYSACGGIDPAKTLPIVLDVGTNNIERRNDTDYLGWRHERVTGKDYDDFLDQFVKIIKKRLPKVLLQFEDFAQLHAYPLLERYRNELCTFNDDIQGTAAVSVATILAAARVAGVKLKDQRIAVLGAGSAGCGISEMLVQAMIAEGISEAKAREQFYLVDRNGLLTQDMEDLLDFQKPFAKEASNISEWRNEEDGLISLLSVIKQAKPSILIGVSGQPGLFTHELVTEMASHCKRPMIFPLSNPTCRSEAHPKDLLEWTKGKALIATGSPFADVEYGGENHVIAQSNNAYIFPGMGLGIIAAKANRVTEEMFMAAAKALSELSPALGQGSFFTKLFGSKQSVHNEKSNALLPPLSCIQEVSRYIAFHVAKKAIEQGLTHEQLSDKGIREAIDQTFWQPVYANLTVKEVNDK